MRSSSLCPVLFSTKGRQQTQRAPGLGRSSITTRQLASLRQLVQEVIAICVDLNVNSAGQCLADVVGNVPQAVGEVQANGQAFPKVLAGRHGGCGSHVIAKQRNGHLPPTYARMDRIMLVQNGCGKVGSVEVKPPGQEENINNNDATVTAAGASRNEQGLQQPRGARAVKSSFSPSAFKPHVNNTDDILRHKGPARVPLRRRKSSDNTITHGLAEHRAMLQRASMPRDKNGHYLAHPGSSGPPLGHSSCSCRS